MSSCFGTARSGHKGKIPVLILVPGLDRSSATAARFGCHRLQGSRVSGNAFNVLRRLHNALNCGHEADANKGVGKRMGEV